MAATINAVPSEKPAPSSLNPVTPTQSLFTSADYLDPLEASGCISPAEGWTARTIELAGAGRLPCYVKAHSWGEFVFDFQIAQAYAQQRLRYYPKLVSCVPFTPVPGPRLLAADDAGRLALAETMIGQAREQRCSGAHILFLPESEAAILPDTWLRRAQLRYVWRRESGGGFEDFLADLPGKQRKNIRRERRLVAESGLDIRWQAANETREAEWPRLFDLYASTYHRRGQEPYLNLACLRAWAANFGERMQFCIARDGDTPVALAFFFREGKSLYGRHWGASAFHDGLHFELCYYQGIEWCLAQGLTHFDAGVQGEHKQARGFAAEFSHSVHWFADERFRSAIARYFAEEQAVLSGRLPETE